MQVQLVVEPLDSLVHEPVRIAAFNLPPGENFCFELRLLSKVGTYKAYAVFKSDVTGSISLEADAPIRGTYTGANGFGLFESVQPTVDVMFGAYCKSTPPDPYNYQLIVTDARSNEVCRASFIKRWLHPLVQRIEIEVGNIRGTLFRPPGVGPFPSVMDMSGTGGGLNEHKGAALASRGFCVLSLAFFQYKDLVNSINDVDIEYFGEALDYLLGLPFTTDKIAVQGVSFGGLVVILLASRYPQINAVVSINGSTAMNGMTAMRERGEQMPFGSLNPSDLYELNGLYCYHRFIQNVTIEEGAEISLEKTSPTTAFRFLSAMDDLAISSMHSARFFGQRLRELGRTVDVQIVPGGHLLDPPCFPHHDHVFAKFVGIHQAYGGDCALHGTSQTKSWQATVDFLMEHIGVPPQIPDYHQSPSKL